MGRYGIRIAAVVLALLLLSSCSGASNFVPNAGPFSGELTANDSVIGDFTFTVTGNLVGGTCTLVHNEQVTVAAISGVIQGNTITGTLRNQNLGSGPFVGNFLERTRAGGTFSYTDAAQVSTQTGTWSARVE